MASGREWIIPCRLLRENKCVPFFLFYAFLDFFGDRSSMIDDNLLLLTDEAWSLPEDFYSCWNARGLYNPLQFVLRLRPDIHKILSGAPNGRVRLGQLSTEQLYAFSTYLHETIHWWQHIGSTTGLFLSLIYPAQSHINHRHLVNILDLLGPIKSLREYNMQNVKPSGEGSDIDRMLNSVLNNWHDIEFYRWLITDPTNFDNKVADPYFDCVGHSYGVAISAVIWLLASTIDPDFEIFPSPIAWDEKSIKLRNEKCVGFYHGSDIYLPPVGARAIFEGQARFCQMQYLYISSGGKLDWDAFEREGMLSGVYVEAFKLFLDITKLEPPSSLDDSVVGLFLLVCDVSINPAEGFIQDILEFKNIIQGHDPGIRFTRLCRAIGEQPKFFASCISDYSTEEYCGITEILCEIADLTNPYDLAQKIAFWQNNCDRVKMLLVEDANFDFLPENLPVRLFLARFIRFNVDKSLNPEFFCWPGIWMTEFKEGGINLERSLSLFDEHKALFLDKEDGDVYPRTFPNHDEVLVQKTFNNFYSWIIVYELIRQWLVESGEFDLDFSWLTSKYSQVELEGWASSQFEQAFGVSISQFNIV